MRGGSAPSFVTRARTAAGPSRSWPRRLGTSQSAINRIEQGNQNLSLDLLTRISEALDSEIVSLGRSGPLHLRVEGGRKLSGSIDVKTSRTPGWRCCAPRCSTRAAPPCARWPGSKRCTASSRCSTASGCKTRWLNSDNDLEIVPPAKFELDTLDLDAARRTRSIIMFLAPLMRQEKQFELPYAGGCALGTRTVEPHMIALRPFGVQVEATAGSYHVEVDPAVRPQRPIVLTERGDTVTENALMAAARNEGVTVIRNASSNYMVQDLCFFLTELGVKIEGIGTTTLTVHGVPMIRKDVDYAPSEDPIEAMSLVTAAIVTGSEITVKRVPIEFMEIELALLSEMGLEFDQTPEYFAANGRTRLVDVTIHPSQLHAPLDKIHPMPFPGLNIDNLPFFALIAATAEGSTLIHDWVYDNRALYLTELTKLGSQGHADGSAPDLRRGADPLVRHRGDLPAGAASGRRGAAGHARGQGHLVASQRLRHRPRLRAAGRPAEPARREHPHLPRRLSPRTDSGNFCGPRPAEVSKIGDGGVGRPLGKIFWSRSAAIEGELLVKYESVKIPSCAANNSTE